MMKNFKITYHGWNPEEQKLREALCTLGNGYFATRGAAEERSNDEFNYPGTYMAGCYNRAKTEISGKMIENEDFVNFPNWLYLSFRPDGGKWLNLDEYKIHDYTQTLNMKEGILIRDMRVEDDEGRRTHIISRRFVSMHYKHRAGLQWQITPENWEGEIEIHSQLDGTVTNDGVPRYRKLESQHLEPIETKQSGKHIMLLKTRTNQSKIVMAQAARTKVYDDAGEIDVSVTTHKQKDLIGQILKCNIKQKKTYAIEKILALHTSKDRAISEPMLNSEKEINRSRRFENHLSDNILAYKNLWRRADIELQNGDRNQRLLRLHIFHVLQTVSFNTINLDVGVPARGLHGEAYRGHIFWDELYIYPYLNIRFPEITRSLLMYRYHRLGEARYAARKAGYKGAMFPWQSGSDGREETQVLHLNPKSGRWLPDDTHLQRHVNAAIAYNVWNYFIATDDQHFLSFFGAKIFLDIAAFWASKAIYNMDRERYEMHGVVGPDEYHTSYPDSEKQGLDNNAYTNVMVAWVLQKALDILKMIEKNRRDELLKELDIDDKELKAWKGMSTKMYVPFHDEDIISQFEGYEKLKEFPWDEYRKKYDNIQRLDRILESEGNTPNYYKASKQADVLMLLYVFSKEELKGIFEKLGYTLTDDMIRRNIDYYGERTSHGSTLSRFVFSWILMKYDKMESWEGFETLLVSDFEDVQGGTTPEGIHLGAMAGSLDLVQRGFAGIEVLDDVLWIKPNLPDTIKRLILRVKYHRHWIIFTIEHDKLTICFDEGWSNTVNIGVIDKVYKFKHGEVKEFKIPNE
jgi:trehalose/maltose hydrolase-like predicted phosphorylase